MNKPIRSEEDVIKGCIANDRIAQEQVYKQHFRPMFQMVHFYCSNEEDAMEILNSGFLRVFQKIQLFRHEGSLAGWIRTVIYHVMISEIKTKQRTKPNIELEHNDAEHHDFTLEKLFKEDLDTLIHQLPPATARAFSLFANEGYSHHEIAEKLNISIGTSKWHISQARELLQHKIKMNHE